MALFRSTLFTFIIMISAAVCFLASIVSCSPNKPAIFDTGSDSEKKELKALFGLTLDFCSTDNDCSGERKCFLHSGDGRCNGYYWCVCAPPTLQPCTKSVECPVGESCAREMRGPFTCMSTYRVESFSFQLTTAEEAIKYPVVGPCDKPTIIRDGLIGDRCKGDEFCAAGRHCIGIYLGDFTCCSTDEEDVAECTCFSVASPDCTKQSDCVKGEACIKTDVAVPQCYSRKAIDKFHLSVQNALVYL